MTDTSFTTRDLMAESGVGFGTSGARGLVSALTDRVAFGYTQGFLRYLREIGEFVEGGAVALAGDLRPSTPRLLRACAEAIRHEGGQPLFCGHAPTPALACYAFGRRIPSLMVTGSHIPADRNGVKFHRARGEALKPDEAGIARQALDLPASLFDAGGALRAPAPLPDATDISAPYLSRYREFFGDGALSGLKLGVYQHSAVGRDLLARLLRDLGAEVTPLGRSDSFVPVDTEALRPEDIALARDWAREHAFDAIVSTDGDSDRPLVADQSGRWLRGDILGLICAHELGADCVVTPVSSNTALERSGWFAGVRRTRIGSPYVIEAMNEAAAEGAAVCGYEANGGFLLGGPVTRNGRSLAPLPTRDAVLPILCALVAARRKPLAEICADLPARVTFSDRLRAFPTARSRAILDWLSPPDPARERARIDDAFGPIAGKLSETDKTDGLRMTFESGAIIHLRPSGNAPELRCYTEAETEGEARRLNAETLTLVRDRLAVRADQEQAA
ncbi:phosphomannomutase [Pikeienuella sp. HZG-20]|uniref:phosphomannomutase n=1 Tax=Paludibacillus litoralis TaxID=3133267 RepID=UPI0030EDEA2D